MKLTIKSEDGRRITRYGVGDFQQNDGYVVAFYPHRITTQTDAPPEEEIEGRVLAGVDSSEDDDLAYRAEDIELEQEKADDLKDYRIE